MSKPDGGAVFGWDIGGAHVKACRLENGAVVDVAQWACPLWQGMDQLERVLRSAVERWPTLAQDRHAVTMTGEMVDLFEHREQGVARIAAQLASVLGTEVQVFAGDAGWRRADEAASAWQDVASANWLATARHAALSTTGHAGGVLVDIGSTTTDLIPFRDGRVLTTSRTDAERLACSELVYQGVVRTPLCALAQRIDWRGRLLNVMNEYFATAADVHRLTRELDPAHDLYPPADNGAKDDSATRRRLARIIGLDERDASEREWLAFAHAWRACQVGQLAEQLQAVIAEHRLEADARIVTAGCGDFLVPAMLRQIACGQTRAQAYADTVAKIAPGAPPEIRAWVQVCAPCVAVAALWDGGRR